MRKTAISRKPAMQKMDAASTKRRDAMREVARRLMAEVNRGPRIDGWQNALTLLGMTGRDKRLSGNFQTTKVVDLEAEDVWRGDPFFARIVDTVPEEICRAGWELQVQPPSKGRKAKDAAADVFADDPETDDGKEISEDMSEFMKELKLVDTIEKALKVERAKGGAAIYLGVNDGQKDLSKPLNLDRIKSLDWIDVLEPLELIPYQWYSDPTEKDFGMPELFWMQRISTGNIGAIQRIPIHVSRLIIFPGTVVSRRQLREHWSWGDSMLVRVGEALRDFQQTWGGVFALMEDVSQSVFKMEGLAQAFATGEDDLLVRRATAMDAARSVIRGILIDKSEEFSRQTTPLGGIAEILDRTCNYLASVAKMPVTIMMGQSPAGLNATGASDIRAWFDSIAATRPRTLEPRLNHITKIAFRAKEGPTGGKEPARWSYAFGSMWQLTDVEEAQKRSTVATTDNTYITAGVLLPEEVAKSRFGGDKYSMETTLNRDVREAYDKKAELEAQQEAAALRQQVSGAGAPGSSASGTGGGPQPPKKPGPPVPKDNEGPQKGPPVPVGSKGQGPQSV